MINKLFFDKQIKVVISIKKNNNKGQMADPINENSQYSSDEQILLPMCTIMPANEIITKQYEPDQAPIIKLITKQIHKEKQLRKNTYNFTQPKFSNPQFTQYAELFASQDFLGMYYADKLDQMVYFKFNNKDYNQLKVGEKKYRFFSGFFVDREHFLDVALQKHDNIMKSFPFLDFVDYNTNLLHSFSKNSSGGIEDPKFSSNYDSANLFAVIRKRPFEYDLILQNDMNSKGNTQWFNFLVHFTEQGTYKFNIVNFTKSHSLYEQGMKIACYSFNKQNYRGNHDNYKNGVGWFRGGKNIKYYRNGIQRQTLGPNDSYSTLSFEYTCKNRAESMIFAHSFPYTSLEMEKYFNKMIYRRVMGHLKMEKFCVGNSIAGQPIYGYMISHRKLRSNSLKFKESFFNTIEPEKSQSNKAFNFSKIFEKRNSSPEVVEQANPLKSIILMARQHSGETQSSFVLQGIVDYLMANTELDQIKKNYLFFVFPMINMDGVKYGHYRTNLCGVDLNRIWRVPRKQSHPEVYHIKKILYEINRNTPISLILDIHGHSKSLNSFFYGNPSKKENLSFEDPKIFPFICSKRIKQISYKQSTFNVREEKKNSARVVLSQMFPKALVYTLENSFYGYVTKKSKTQNELDEQEEINDFTPQGYRRVGRQLMSTYLQYTRLCEKNTTIKAKWMKEMDGIYAELQKSKSVELNDDGGSDSELQNELIEFEEKPINKTKTQTEQKNISPRKIDKSNTIFQKKTCIFRRSQKKKTMPLPKTICEQNVRGMTSHNIRTFNNLSDINDKSKFNASQNKENIFARNTSEIPKNPQYPQAVLSIFKIETQKSTLLRKKNTISSLLGYQDTTSTSGKDVNDRSKLSPPPNLLSGSISVKPERGQSKITIHRLKKQPYEQPQKKMNLDDVINKCTGMKTFLKAMGITIQNRKS